MRTYYHGTHPAGAFDILRKGLQATTSDSYWGHGRTRIPRSYVCKSPEDAAEYGEVVLTVHPPLGIRVRAIRGAPNEYMLLGSVSSDRIEYNAEYSTELPKEGRKWP